MREERNQKEETNYLPYFFSFHDSFIGSGWAATTMQANEVSVSADTRGRHRISAELQLLDQEARFLEEELEELEKTERVSATLQELLQKVESKPDPLLTVTNGPINLYWDRWFEGPQDMHGCRCWIL